ncbi:unnamed protein product [Didymodactylos carnosus]|uniref:Mitochondrial carrier protein n=2 Tax=Didymodactylos carnosus TaxID=1234261 RepID=A0A8S2RSA2_9BILA|nr:unnamed protein product [Didymodactylos carnosus]CAF4185711.1 unnamed protein product [Didymodactylos carnosus]
MTAQILRTEGIRGLFRGLTSTWIREVPGYFFFFGGYELTRSLLMSKDGRKTDIGFVKIWISGGMAGITFWIIMYPCDVIKSRQQVFTTNKSFLNYTLTIIRNEGLVTLYSGLMPTLIRTFFATGALFITYEKVRLLLGLLLKSENG